MVKKGPPSRYNPEKVAGQVFNGIRIVCHDHDKITTSKNHPTWTITDHYVKCICPLCGTEFIASYNRIVNGYTRSCGCLKVEKARIRLGNIARTHGKRYTRLYRIWMGMRMRCYNKHNKSYADYGGRGIYICNEWMKTGPDNPGFMNFYNWAYDNGYYDQPDDTPYGEMLSIDRIDNDGPYAPWNCRWITIKIQRSNMSTNKYIYDGDNVFKYFEFCEYYGVDVHFVSHRVYAGWSLNAIVYAAKHKEREIRKGRDGNYYDKNGFMVMIPNYQEMKRKDI